MDCVEGLTFDPLWRYSILTDKSSDIDQGMTSKILKFMLAFLCLPLLAASACSAGSPPTSTMPPPETVDTYDDLIRVLETQQAEVTDPESRDIVTEKLEMFSMLATQRAEAVTANQGKFQPYFSTPIPIPVHRLPEGIDNDPVIPTSASHLIITNAWRKYTPEKSYILWAGALRSDPAQGVIYYLLPNPQYGFIEYYAPQKSGALRIVSFDEFVLELTSESGSVFHFDALNKTFLDPEGHPITTPTQPVQVPTAYL